jgi:hypothetical protein
MGDVHFVPFFVNIDDTLIIIYIYIWIYMFMISVMFTCDDVL